MNIPRTNTPRKNNTLLENLIVPASIAASLTAAPALANNEPAPADTTSITRQWEEFLQQPLDESYNDLMFTTPGVPIQTFADSTAFTPTDSLATLQADTTNAVAIADSLTTANMDSTTAQRTEEPLAQADSTQVLPATYTSMTAQFIKEYVGVDEKGIYVRVKSDEDALNDFTDLFKEQGIAEFNGVRNEPSTLNDLAASLYAVLHSQAAMSDKLQEGQETYFRLIEVTPNRAEGEPARSIGDLLWDGRDNIELTNPNTIDEDDRFYLVPELNAPFRQVVEATTLFNGDLVEATAAFNADFEALLEQINLYADENHQLQGRILGLEENKEQLVLNNEQLTAERDTTTIQLTDTTEKLNSLASLIANTHVGVEVYALPSTSQLGYGVTIGVKGIDLSAGRALRKVSEGPTHTDVEYAPHHTLPIQGVSRYTHHEELKHDNTYNFSVRVPINEWLKLGVGAIGSERTKRVTGSSETYFEIDGEQVDYNRTPINDVSRESTIHVGPEASIRLLKRDRKSLNAIAGLYVNPDQKPMTRVGLNYQFR